MSNIALELPVVLFTPSAKYDVINYLVDLGVPARVSINAFKGWAEAVGYTQNDGDIQLLANHLNLLRQPLTAHQLGADELIRRGITS